MSCPSSVGCIALRPSSGQVASSAPGGCDRSGKGRESRIASRGRAVLLPRPVGDTPISPSGCGERSARLRARKIVAGERALEGVREDVAPSHRAAPGVSQWGRATRGPKSLTRPASARSHAMRLAGSPWVDRRSGEVSRVKARHDLRAAGRLLSPICSTSEQIPRPGPTRSAPAPGSSWREDARREVDGARRERAVGFARRPWSAPEFDRG